MRKLSILVPVLLLAMSPAATGESHFFDKIFKPEKKTDPAKDSPNQYSEDMLSTRRLW